MRALARYIELMRFIALLRGINVGGAGILPMKDLAALCESLGLKSIRTYIQSGNVIFDSPLAEPKLKAQLERALETRMGKPISVMLRTAEELRAVRDGNPFPDREPNKIGVHFLNESPTSDLLKTVVAPAGEEVRLGPREVYVYYPIGMGQSKLKLKLGGAAATVRNINTVSKLVELAQA